MVYHLDTIVGGFGLVEQNHPFSEIIPGVVTLIRASEADGKKLLYDEQFAGGIYLNPEHHIRDPRYAYARFLLYTENADGLPIPLPRVTLGNYLKEHEAITDFEFQKYFMSTLEIPGRFVEKLFQLLGKNNPSVSSREFFNELNRSLSPGLPATWNLDFLATYFKEFTLEIQELAEFYTAVTQTAKEIMRGDYRDSLTFKKGTVDLSYLSDARKIMGSYPGCLAVRAILAGKSHEPDSKILTLEHHGIPQDLKPFYVSPFSLTEHFLTLETLLESLIYNYAIEIQHMKQPLVETATNLVVFRRLGKNAHTLTEERYAPFLKPHFISSETRKLEKALIKGDIDSFFSIPKNSFNKLAEVLSIISAHIPQELYRAFHDRKELELDIILNPSSARSIIESREPLVCRLESTLASEFGAKPSLFRTYYMAFLSDAAHKRPGITKHLLDQRVDRNRMVFLSPQEFYDTLNTYHLSHFSFFKNLLFT